MPASLTPTLSRRALLGWLVASGAAALLGACSGATNAATTAPAGSEPTSAAAASTATDIAIPAAETKASIPTPIATAARGTSTVSGTRSATVAALPTAGVTPPAGALLAALATVPQSDVLPGLAGIAYADFATLKKNYGLGGANSPLDARALVTDGAALAAFLRAIPLPPEAGTRYALDATWQNTLGYDLWQIDRTITSGNGPSSWTRMIGRFDRTAIGAVLTKAGHKPSPFLGVPIMARGDDAQIGTVSEPFTELTLMRFDRVIVEDGALTTTNRLALAQGGLNVAAQKQPGLAGDDDHAALAAALGPVVGARLLAADPFLHPVRATSQTAAAVATGGAQLHAYRRVGLGLRDDGANHTMVVALAYAQQADANADLATLRARAATYVLASGEPLSARATVGQPTIVTANNRAVVVLPFTIADPANLDLWQQLYFREEYGFLAL